MLSNSNIHRSIDADNLTPGELILMPELLPEKIIQLEIADTLGLISGNVLYNLRGGLASILRSSAGAKPQTKICFKHV